MPKTFDLPETFNGISGRHIAGIEGDKIIEIRPYPIVALGGSVSLDLSAVESTARFNQQQREAMDRVKAEFESKYSTVLIGKVDTEQRTFRKDELST